MRYARTIVPMSVVAALAGASLLAAPAVRPQDPGQDRGGSPLDGEMLVQGLMQTEGCLGVDRGQWASGKNTIIAWFEDKEAVVRWYDSRTHRGVMAFFTQGAEEGEFALDEPLAHVPDGSGPIMVMASLTPTPDGGSAHGMPMPISQISIELFQPLPGGAHVGGRLAPETFEVPHMRDYTPQEGAAGD